jgi:hypothetical protein
MSSVPEEASSRCSAVITAGELLGTARLFSSILHHEISAYAAWMPVTNTFRLGDYGVISDGVFVKMGNIEESACHSRKPMANRPS